MRKIFTLLSFFTASFSFAGTPTIDGVINASDGYSLINIADGNAGWDGTNAKLLYFTEDASYYYFAASVTASNWMSYGLILNTTASAGGTTDGWGRKINYTHTEKPDVEVRGNFNNSWAELHKWTGSAWDGTGVNVQPGNAVSSIAGSNANGAVEIRIAKATIGTFSVMGAQFYITGDNNDHANFDAVPNDNNTTAWNGITTDLSQYAQSNVTLPLNLVAFSASIKENTANLKWSTKNEQHASHFEVEQSSNSREWNKVAIVPAKNTASANYSSVVNFTGNKQYYRLKMVDTDGKFSYSSTVLVKAGGNEKFDLPATAIRSELKFKVNSEAASISAELISLSGQKVAAEKFNHTGGETTFRMNVSNLQPGIYILNLTANGDRTAYRIIIQ
jgi:hypothetical protein